MTPSDAAPDKGIELKACPFCGFKAKERTTWMCCTNPKCHLFNSACRDADEWNTRAPLAPPEGELGEAVNYFKVWRKELTDPAVYHLDKIIKHLEATQSQPSGVDKSVEELNRRIIGLIDYAADYIKTLPEDCMGREQDDPEVGYRGWAYRDEWLHNANEIKALLNGNTGEK